MRKKEKIELIVKLQKLGFQIIPGDDGWDGVLPAGVMAIRLYHHTWRRIDMEHLECGTYASIFTKTNSTWHSLTMFFRVPENFAFPESGLHPPNHFGVKISYFRPGTAVPVPPTKDCKWVSSLPEDLTTLSELPQMFWPLGWSVRKGNR